MIETVVRGLTVTLCPAELEWTRRVGERMAKRGQGLKPRYAAEYPGRFRETHIVGARSELTCAWVTGKLWLGRDTWKGADIEGTNWQVRWSKRNHQRGNRANRWQRRGLGRRRSDLAPNRQAQPRHQVSIARDANRTRGEGGSTPFKPGALP